MQEKTGHQEKLGPEEPTTLLVSVVGFEGTRCAGFVADEYFSWLFLFRLLLNLEYNVYLRIHDG